MKILRTQFHAKGFQFEQLERTPTCALYRKRKPAWTPGRYSYEVILVRVRKGGEWNGVTFDDSEAYPNDEQFGRLGWTHMSEAAARSDFVSRATLKSPKSGQPV